ncbi:hypothetical protein QNO00_16350 [Arthrobacter sp. zg-Y1219]|uniref:hypothetical protein n=1 Tax=Arthrobacter sp. zg-Y1219 TaxID=3049067 RepID=UPI0024C36ABE|nr:hypothetical protein [Arthrobacter sp. zg-Y1219]MDK1361825.1 hypothetical protein [Arthrobacter sp. zg-Y1219]
MASEILVWLGIYALAAAMLVPGIAAYRGIWRRWAPQQQPHELGKHSYFGFTMFYGGLLIAIGMTGAIFTVLGAPQFVSDVLLLAGALVLMLVVASVIHLPRVLLPSWYCQWVDAGAREDDVLLAGSNPYTWVFRSRAGRQDTKRAAPAPDGSANRQTGPVHWTLSVSIVRPYRQRTAKCKKLGK